MRLPHGWLFGCCCSFTAVTVTWCCPYDSPLLPRLLLLPHFTLIWAGFGYIHLQYTRSGVGYVYVTLPFHRRYDLIPTFPFPLDVWVTLITLFDLDVAFTFALLDDFIWVIYLHQRIPAFDWIYYTFDLRCTLIAQLTARGPTGYVPLIGRLFGLIGLTLLRW